MIFRVRALTEFNIGKNHLFLFVTGTQADRYGDIGELIFQICKVLIRLSEA